jgi:hypothetical protein
MNAYFAANRLSDSEKEDILKQHRTLYDGYRTLQPHVNNEQPLYVQDFAKDKVGAVINNKGVVKPYTNVGINEQSEPKHMCEQCGSMMNEKECMECGWKGEVGAMEEGKESMCSECGSEMYEGECSECGSKMESIEETGHLSDIYNVEDLGDDEFDYVEGGGNKYGTFEKMHHMKGIKKEGIDDYEDPDNEDDGFEDLQADGGEMYEQGYTGGGNAPDMDISNIDPAYGFKSDGPSMGDEPYDIEADDMDLDKSKEMDAFDFQSNGPDSVYPTESVLDEDDDYEFMESAFNDDEIEEANDISGVQGIYGDMEPAYDFDSDGPGSAGPYQTSSWSEGEMEEQYLPTDVWDDAHKKGHVKTHKELGIDSEDDFDEDELKVDFDKFDPRDKSWEEITAFTGDDEFGSMDEDIKESFIQQKNKITEMFIRMKVIK